MFVPRMNADGDTDSSESDDLNGSNNINKRGPYRQYIFDASVPIPKSTKHDLKRRTIEQVIQ